MKAKAPNIRHVAEAAGVSTATVSRALSSPGLVSSSTRDAVLEAIERTGYRVNIAARNLRRNEAGAVAVLVPDLANPFFSTILSGVAEVMSEAGYNVVVFDTTPFAEEEHRFPGFASKQHVDGLILLDGLLDHDVLVNRGPPEARPPVVFACEWSDALERPRVTIDNEAAGALAVRHLLRLGHRRIGHVTGPPANVLTHARLTGAKSEMAAQGLEIAPEWIYPGDFSFESGARAAQTWFGAENRPTAVFCASDVMAIGFVGEVLRRGGRVPEDVSVIGFDDVEMAAHMVPALTTIRQPRLDIGRSAAEMLLDRMRTAYSERSAARPPRVILPVELVVRNSDAAPS